MVSNARVKEIVDDLFEEEALVIGGMAAVHELEDDLVWRLVRNLDDIRRKVLRRIDEKVPDGVGANVASSPNSRRHPAVEEFLLRLKRG